MLLPALWSQWGLNLPRGADLEQKLESFEPQIQLCRLFNFRYPHFISRCRRSSEAGNMSSSLVLSAHCSCKIEHPSANLSPPEFSPVPLIHHITWLIHTARYQPSPVVHIRAVITSPRTIYFFGADKLFKASIWDQIYPWCNSIEVTGVLYLREMWSYCIKADFSPPPFHLPLYEFEISSFACDLFMFILWGLSFFKYGILLHYCSCWKHSND